MHGSLCTTPLDSMFFYRMLVQMKKSKSSMIDSFQFFSITSISSPQRRHFDSSVSRSIRLLLLKEFKQHQSQSVFLSLATRHTRDKDESIRSFCLSALQDAGIATIESVLGEEGVFDSLRRIAAAPYNETYHSLVTHLLRYAILKTAQKKDVSLTQLGEDALLHLLGEGTFSLPSLCSSF